MRHFQRLKNVVLNVLVKWFAGYTLKNITGKRRRVVRIGWGRTRGKDSDRQMLFQVLVEWGKIPGISHEKLLGSFFEPRGVGHDIAQRNRFGISRRNLEIDVVVDVAIQVEFPQLDLLHDRSPIEQF